MPYTPTKATPNKKARSPVSRTPKRASIGNFDKFECSPNNMAKCFKCRKKIFSGTKRVGLRDYCERYGAYFRYYHDECYPNKQSLSLAGGRTPEDELAKHKKEEIEKGKLLSERWKLREMLRQVRRLYAQRLGCADFLVFHDTTLDDLTLKMPRNKTEMMSVYGMGPKRFQNIGNPLLEVIGKYSGGGQESPSSSARPSRPPENTARQAKTQIVTSDDAEDDASDSDGELFMGKTFSVNEIVNRQFAEAETMGYMITIDDESLHL